MKKNWLTRILAMSLSVMMAAVLALPAAALDGATKITLAATIDSGDDFLANVGDTVTVKLNANAGMDGYQGVLTYDAAVLEFVSASSSAVHTYASGATDLSNWTVNPNKVGEVTLLAVDTAGLDVSKEVATATFKLKSLAKVGKTTIGFTGVKGAAGDAGVALSAASTEVQVGQEAATEFGAAAVPLVAGAERSVSFRFNGQSELKGAAFTITYNEDQLVPQELIKGAKIAGVTVTDTVAAEKTSQTGTITVSFDAPGVYAVSSDDVFSIRFKVNNSVSTLTGKVAVPSAAAGGKTLTGKDFDYTVAANGAAKIEVDPAKAATTTLEVEAKTDIEPVVNTAPKPDGMLKNISPAKFDSVEKVVAKLQVSVPVDYTILKADGTAKAADEAPATGDTLTLAGGDTVVLAVKGDANGDANVDVFDILSQKKSILEMAGGILVDPYYTAAYVTKSATSDGLSVLDILKVKSYTLDMETL